VALVAEWTDNLSDTRVVGQGAFGKVYEGVAVSDAARRARLGLLAVKVLSPDMVPEGGDKHLTREIAVLRSMPTALC
jgi:hypothetical protein